MGHSAHRTAWGPTSYSTRRSRWSPRCDRVKKHIVPDLKTGDGMSIMPKTRTVWDARWYPGARTYDERRTTAFGQRRMCRRHPASHKPPSRRVVLSASLCRESALAVCRNASVDLDGGRSYEGECVEGPMAIFSSVARRHLCVMNLPFSHWSRHSDPTEGR